MSGVYAIVDRATGKAYVGSAQHAIRQRFGEHQRALRSGAHSSPLLQADYLKHGEEAFELRVVIYCEPFECSRYEQFFIDRWRERRALYNANPIPFWDFSNRGGRGYLPPKEARRNRENIREFNRLFKALSAEGFPFEEANRIASVFYPKHPQ